MRFSPIVLNISPRAFKTSRGTISAELKFELIVFTFGVSILSGRRLKEKDFIIRFTLGEITLPLHFTYGTTGIAKPISNNARAKRAFRLDRSQSFALNVLSITHRKPYTTNCALSGRIRYPNPALKPTRPNAHHLSYLAPHSKKKRPVAKNKRYGHSLTTSHTIWVGKGRKINIKIAQKLFLLPTNNLPIKYKEISASSLHNKVTL
jgi:hypothetical protein